MSQQREEGHYWVIYSGEWEVAFWDGGVWWLLDGASGYRDSDLERILESKLPHPDEAIDQPTEPNPVVFFNHDPTQTIKAEDIAAVIATPTKSVAMDVMSRLIAWRKERTNRSFQIKAASEAPCKTRAFKIVLRSDDHMIRVLHGEQRDLSTTLSDMLDQWEQAGY